MEILEHKEMPFPEDLEERLNAVFNIVNTELKSATLLVLDDSPAEASEIKARVRNLIGGGYLPRGTTFDGYCHDTLFPIGAVAKETIRREEVEDVFLAYSLTEAGRRYGRPITALALQYAVDCGLSLHQVLGSTCSSGKTRAPLNRIKILKALSQGERRLTDLVEGVELAPSVIYNALEDLKKIGFVYYESVGEHQKGKGVITYRLLDGNREVKTVKQTTLTKKALELLRDRKSITVPEAMELFDFSQSHLWSIYSGLVKQGFAIRDRGFVGRQIQSKARILDRASSLLELEARIEDILTDKVSTEEVQDIYLDFVTSPNYEERGRAAVEQYVKVSGHINSKSFEERAETIKQVLTKNPGLRTSEIGRILDYNNINGCLSPMVKAGTLRVEKQGKE